ncbi:MAG: hypothetical protein M1381_09670 [Deltaproteobacteria bacterium]|nr:hypothetical protein [Deltaproteobacteria bacterium]MCL5792359.1 hypothetical protein [Deltaproteobacteria bacterium]
MKTTFNDAESGNSKFTILVSLLIIGFIIYIIIKIAPVYLVNFELENMFQVNADRIQTTPINMIKQDIAEQLASMHAPITLNDVSILQNATNDITISASYSAEVKLLDYYKIKFHFNPKAETGG